MYYYPGIYKDMARQTHLLIAGASGSGKSTLIQGILFALLLRDPVNAQLVLIDPKRVELIDYKRTTNAIAYASETRDAIKVLNQVCDMMDDRYKNMQRMRTKRFTGNDVYVIIDEYADLVTTGGKDVETPVCRIAQLGRACGIHLILATQRPTREIINGKVKVNLDAQVALHTINSQDSRNIIGVKGAENLPRYGECYYYTPDMYSPERHEVPMIDQYDFEEVLQARIKERSFWRRRL